jgi:hypothetical protein
MIATLNELVRLLAKHDHHGKARVVQGLVEALQAGNQTEFVTLLHSVDMWGGSGAVWEVGELGEDKQAFQCAIIQLSADMDQAGLGTERSRFIASTFVEWNRMRI